MLNVHNRKIEGLTYYYIDADFIIKTKCRTNIVLNRWLTKKKYGDSFWKADRESQIFSAACVYSWLQKSEWLKIDLSSLSPLTDIVKKKLMHSVVMSAIFTSELTHFACQILLSSSFYLIPLSLVLLRKNRGDAHIHVHIYILTKWQTILNILSSKFYDS